MMVTFEEWAQNVNKEIEALKQQQKWQDKRIDTAFEQLEKLREEVVNALLLNPIRERIISVLKSQPHLTQAQAMNKILKPFSEAPLSWHAFYKAWEQLEKTGVITAEHHGKGHARTWILTEKETKP